MVSGRSCSREQLFKNNLQSEISKNICKQGWKQEQNPKQLNKVPKQSYEKQVPEQGPNEQV